MAKFWRVMGVILIVLDVVGMVILLFNGGGLLATLIDGFFGGLSGALMITVGGLIERVEGLEYSAHQYPPGVGGVYSMSKPRKTCGRCEREYDADYSSCPYCGSRG